MPHIAREKWRADRAAIHPIAIGLAASGMARMELGGHLRNLQHPHRGRQNVVQRLQEIFRGDGRLRDKCHDLRERVHSRVGSARPLRQYLFAGNASNGRGKCALHGARVGLHLPSGEFRPVIGEDQFEISHAIFRVPRAVRIIQSFFGLNSSSMSTRQGIVFPVRYTRRFPRNPGFDRAGSGRATPGIVCVRTIGRHGEVKRPRSSQLLRNLSPLLCVPMPE